MADDEIRLFEQAITSEVNLGDVGLSSGELIDPYLDEHLTSGTRVVVPQGTYVWDGSGFHDRNFSSDAELVGDGMVTLQWRSGRAAHTDIDVQSGTFRMANFTFVGEVVTGDESGDHEINPSASSGATIEFVNVHMPQGTRGQDRSEASAYYVPRSHDGTVRWIDCSVEWWGNNGWYASSPGKDGDPGRCEWIRCYARNNNIAGIRCGGGPYLIKDTVIVNDAVASSRIKSGRKQRGIRFDEPGGPGRLENVHITTAGVSNAPPMIVSNDGRGGSATAQNVFIRNEEGEDAIDLNGDYDLSGTNLHLTGSGNLSYDGDWSGECVGSGCTRPRTTPITDGGVDPGKEHARLDIISTTPDNFEYEFIVQPTEKANASVRQHPDDFESNDSWAEGPDGHIRATGRTGETFRDIWEFRGRISNFVITLGQREWVRFEVNGEHVDSLQGVAFPEPDPEPPTEPGIKERAKLAITNGDTAQATSYHIEVAGEVTQTYGFEPAETVETGDGTTVVEGFVAGAFDGFDYTGCVKRFAWNGPNPSVYRHGDLIPNSSVVECPPEETEEDPLIRWIRQNGLGLMLIAGAGAGVWVASKERR